MKPASRLAVFTLASAALLLAGCTKKPVRPYPGETMMGPQNGASSIAPTEVPTTADENSGLQARGAGDFDANGQLRGALEPVYFDLDQYNIKPSEQTKLQAAKDYLDKNPQYRLLIEGHCDWRGTAEYNLALGDRRANEAKKYLITLGVSADKLETLSKGSEEAIQHGDETAMGKDRRDELVVLKQ